MACCKGGSTYVAPEISQSHNTGIIIKNYIVKFIIFLAMMTLMPVILLVIAYILFKNIVLSNDVNIIPLLREYIGKLDKKRKGYEEDIEDEFEEYDEADYELINVEKIN